MAFSFTVTEKVPRGSHWLAFGTFTTADGDTSGTLDASTHGLNYIMDHDIKFEVGGVATPNPKVTISSGTITITVDNTEGYSGTWKLLGK
jgi:hypothetical protein